MFCLAGNVGKPSNQLMGKLTGRSKETTPSETNMSEKKNKRVHIYVNRLLVCICYACILYSIELQLLPPSPRAFGAAAMSVCMYVLGVFGTCVHVCVWVCMYFCLCMYVCTISCLCVFVHACARAIEWCDVCL